MTHTRLRWSHTNRSPTGGVAVDELKAKGLDVEFRQVPIVPNVDNLWLELQLDDRWMAAYRLTIQKGQPRVAEVRVFPYEENFPTRPPGEWSGEWEGIRAKVPRNGITSRLWKSVPVHVALLKSEDILNKVRNEFPRLTAVWEAFGLRTPGSPTERVERRGRKAVRSRVFYAEVADVYDEAVRTGRRPAQHVKEHFKALTPPPTMAAVRSWIHRARTVHHFLTAASQGKVAPGPALTALGRLALEEVKPEEQAATGGRQRARRDGAPQEGR